MKEISKGGPLLDPAYFRETAIQLVSQDWIEFEALLK